MTPRHDDRATPMVQGRRADSARRQRVIKALNDANTAGEEISVSAIARKSGCGPHLLLPASRSTRPTPRP
jgi:hypothetical protein